MARDEHTWTRLWLDKVPGVSASRKCMFPAGMPCCLSSTGCVVLLYREPLVRLTAWHCSAVLFVNLWSDYAVFVLCCLKYPLKAQYRTPVLAGSVLFDLTKVHCFFIFLLACTSQWLEMNVAFFFVYLPLHPIIDVCCEPGIVSATQFSEGGGRFGMNKECCIIPTLFSQVPDS